MLSESTPQSSAPAGTGYLIFHITTARGAIPLEGARVDIRDYERGETAPETTGDVLFSLVSGRDGNTPKIALPAPPRANSEKPGMPAAYSRYQAEVALEGYYRQTYIGIPVFDGITAIQPAVLIPIPESGTADPGQTRFFETEDNNAGL